MDLARLSRKGQNYNTGSNTEKLQLKEGDKVMIFEEGGRFYIENPSLLAFQRVEQAFDGAAKDAGFETEEEMQDYMKEIRKEVRGY